MANPLVDVVMVAYRSEADLPSVLDGLRTMSALPHQLHFHDNIGNTKTLTIAWNELASRGKAEYIVFLNTDIRLSPEWDARLVAGLERHADAGAVMPRPIGQEWKSLIKPSWPRFPDQDTAPAPTNYVMRELSKAWKDKIDDYSFGGNCNAAFYAVMIRRSIWEDLKGFDERFRFYGQDHDFQRRLLSRFGKYAKVIDCAPVWHRCAGSVKKALQHGDVDFNAEMNHCGHVTGQLKAGLWLEWDCLSADDRARVRMNPTYTKMPTLSRRG